MGSSAKRKKEKNKDFQKPKLKVGKAKPKPVNFTDTSFKAKSIVLQKQSLSTAPPSASAQFAHHVSLLRSRSDDQRSESLAYLHSVVVSRSVGVPLPEPPAVLLPRLQPLIVDGSSAVRQQLLKLFHALPSKEIARQPENLLLYTHVAMTHLSADIRSFGLEVLNWLTKIASKEVVSCAGGWMKTLRCFVRQLGWEVEVKSNGWSTFQSSGVKALSERKAVSNQLLTFASFINAGIGPPSKESMRTAQDSKSTTFPLRNLEQHLLPQRPTAFEHLHLFGAPPDEDGRAYEDREDRQQLFVKHFMGPIMRGIGNIKKEGGELGRASAAVGKAIEEGTADLQGRTEILKAATR